MQIMNYCEQILRFGSLAFCVIAIIAISFVKYSSEFFKIFLCSISCLLVCLGGLELTQFWG